MNATILKEAVRPPRQSDGGMIVGEPPFGGDAFVMRQVMPPAGTLRSFVDSLTPARWSSVLARLPAQSDTLLVRLPKFRLEVTRKLNEDLAALGVPSPFVRAQLNPMFESPAWNRVSSQVVQKVFVKALRSAPLYLPHRTPEYTTRPIAGIRPRERSTSTKRSVRFLAVMKSAAPTPGIE